MAGGLIPSGSWEPVFPRLGPGAEAMYWHVGGMEGNKIIQKLVLFRDADGSSEVSERYKRFRIHTA